MFNASPDQRLSLWSEFRKNLETSEQPLEDIAKFWRSAPTIAFNNTIDPYYQASWPTPWEIIYDNKYDDFTLSIMMGWTILLTERFKNSKVEIKTLIDDSHNRMYNVVYVDDIYALNYIDEEVVPADKVPGLYRMENLVHLTRPR